MRKILLAAVFMVPALAWAAPTTASDWYKEGANQYTLGNFDKAVDAFKRAFELETDDTKRAAYLYNIAQSYRQANDCAKAQFFYRRFLSLKATDTVKPLSAQERKNTEDFIRDLEPCVQQAASLGKRPPETLQGNGDDKAPPPDTSKDHKEPAKDVATVARPPDAEDDTGVEPTVPVRSSAPSVISARVTAGVTKVFAGPVVGVPVQATFAGTVGYPIAINDKLTIEVGAVGTLTPIPFQKMMVGAVSENNTAYLIGAVADAGVNYQLSPKLGARFDVGIGALFFSNVSGSRFIKGGQADGALTMFHVRGALSVDYAATPNLVVTATPFAYSFSPPKDGMDESITALTSIDFMVGLGYRM